MFGVLTFVIVFVMPSTAGNELCKALQRRSLAAYQPFQLPYYDESELRIPKRIAEEPYSMHVEWYPGWVFVTKHNCSSHVQVLKAFGCHGRSSHL